MKLYKIKGADDRRYLCVAGNRYRAVWLNSRTFSLESLLAPRSVWIPLTTSTLVKFNEPADYELIDCGLTLEEAYSQLALLELLEA